MRSEEKRPFLRHKSRKAIETFKLKRYFLLQFYVCWSVFFFFWFRIFLRPFVIIHASRITRLIVISIYRSDDTRIYTNQSICGEYGASDGYNFGVR